MKGMGEPVREAGKPLRTESTSESMAAQSEETEGEGGVTTRMTNCRFGQNFLF